NPASRRRAASAAARFQWAASAGRYHSKYWISVFGPISTVSSCFCLSAFLSFSAHYHTVSGGRMSNLRQRPRSPPAEQPLLRLLAGDAAHLVAGGGDGVAQRGFVQRLLGQHHRLVF